jgi:ATP-dependent Clp protease ATP-binding subunit ClpA
MGTEHLLLGLLAIEDGIGAQVLRDLGVNAGEVKRQVQDRLDSGPKAVVDHFPFTPRSKQALELSLRHALSLGNDYIDTEHMLLGLLEVPDGLARQILEEMGVTLAVAHERVTTALVAQGWTPPPKRPRRRLRLRGYPGVIGQPTSTPVEVRNRRLLTELTAIISENGALRSEVSRLRHLLAEHQIDPGQSASGEKPA